MEHPLVMSNESVNGNVCFLRRQVKCGSEIIRAVASYPGKNMGTFHVERPLEGVSC